MSIKVTQYENVAVLTVKDDLVGDSVDISGKLGRLTVNGKIVRFVEKRDDAEKTG